MYFSVEGERKGRERKESCAEEVYLFYVDVKAQSRSTVPTDRCDRSREAEVAAQSLETDSTAGAN